MEAGVPDVHSQKPLYELRINKAGLKKVRLPPVVHGSYWLIPVVSAYVDVPSHRRGIHVSRLYKAIYTVFNELGRLDHEFLATLASRLLETHEESLVAEASFSALAITKVGDSEYKGSRRIYAKQAVWRSGKAVKYSAASLLVSSACPCALEVSEYLYGKPYTHNSKMRVTAVLKSSTSVPDPLELLDYLASTLREPINYLNRLGEARFAMEVTSSPMFAEDVARLVVKSIVEKYKGSLGVDGVVAVRVKSVEPFHEYDLEVWTSRSVE